MQTLMSEVESRQASLLGLFERAARRTPPPLQPREDRVNADRFLAAASRHTAATVGVLLPTTKRGAASERAQVREFVGECKTFERTLVKAKARLYGQAQTMGESWISVSDAVSEQLAVTANAERQLVALLALQLDLAAEAALLERFVRTVERAQTRPHPHLPHTGFAGRVARTLCTPFDALWDELEGRVISEGRVGHAKHEASSAHTPPASNAAA